ncbi:MAG: winged helix DNA-binding protein [bacterium]|nr:winged helix DNA-binding protein [bacterium]
MHGNQRSVGLAGKSHLMECTNIVGRLHKEFLKMIKFELDGLGIYDINNVQGLVVYNIGDAKLTVGELTLRGCYHGLNSSYNVKKLVENDYLVYERSVHDRRSIYVQLTDKGCILQNKLSAMCRRHAKVLAQTSDADDSLREVIVTLRRLERFWVHAGDCASRVA